MIADFVTGYVIFHVALSTAKYITLAGEKIIYFLAINRFLFFFFFRNARFQLYRLVIFSFSGSRMTADRLKHRHPHFFATYYGYYIFNSLPH